MSIFEYVMVLVSMIIGLAIAQMLEGVLRVMRGGRPYGTYWVHSVWVGLTFLQLIAMWFYRWEDFQGQSSWTLWQLLFFIMPTVLLFLAAGILFPREAGGLRSHYFEHHRIFFTLWLATMVLYSIETWWLSGLGFGNRGDAFRLALSVLCVLQMVSSHERVHVIGTIVQTAITLVSLTDVLGEGAGGAIG